MATGRKTRALNKHQLGAVTRDADAAQTASEKKSELIKKAPAKPRPKRRIPRSKKQPSLSTSVAPTEMSAGKPLALSPEQIQWVKDRTYAQVYGEPIGNEAVADILRAVGTEHVPADLN